MLANQHRAVGSARPGALRKRGIRRGAFIEHLEAEFGRLPPQSFREQVCVDQLYSVLETIARASALQHSQAQRFKLADQLADLDSRKIQSLLDSLFGVHFAVG